MPDKPTKAADERISLHGHDPEEVLRALLAVDPDSKPAESCPKTWQGKRCKLKAGHFGPCQYDV
jgi:hypothetical protein